jgi:hypothetical protein
VLSVTSTTTGAPGSNASVSISGTTPAQALAFTIPRGDVGATGSQGPIGNTGPQGAPGSPGIITVAASAPASPETGRLWWNTTRKELTVYDGTAWQVVVGTWA